MEELIEPCTRVQGGGAPLHGAAGGAPPAGRRGHLPQGLLQDGGHAGGGQESGGDHAPSLSTETVQFLTA